MPGAGEGEIMANGLTLSFARNGMMVLRTAAQEMGRLPMTGLSNNFGGFLSTSGGARRGQALIEASMAGAALVAMADGDVSFAERALVDQAIDALAARAAIEHPVAVSAFEDFVDGIRRNSSQGREPALAAIAALAGLDGATDEAAVVLRIAEAVARADGGVSDEKRAVLSEIAGQLDARSN